MFCQQFLVGSPTLQPLEIRKTNKTKTNLASQTEHLVHIGDFFLFLKDLQTIFKKESMVWGFSFA